MPLLKSLNLAGGRATNKDQNLIQTGQIVEFVSYHCILDVILSCDLLHIIGIWGP